MVAQPSTRRWLNWTRADFQFLRRGWWFMVALQIVGIAISITLALLTHSGIIVDGVWKMAPRMAYWGTGMLLIQLLVFIGLTYGEHCQRQTNT